MLTHHPPEGGPASAVVVGAVAAHAAFPRSVIGHHTRWGLLAMSGPAVHAAMGYDLAPALAAARVGGFGAWAGRHVNQVTGWVVTQSTNGRAMSTTSRSGSVNNLTKKNT